MSDALNGRCLNVPVEDEDPARSELVDASNIFEIVLAAPGFAFARQGRTELNPAFLHAG